MPNNRPPRPQTVCEGLANPPRALTPLLQLQHWVCWRWVWNGRKWDKPLFRVDQPDRYAKSNDPTTWGSHRDAVSAVTSARAHGRGFVLTDTEFAAIDLDRCCDPATGVTAPWAEDILDRASNAYRERTVSNTGYRIIGTATGAPVHSAFPIEGGGQVEVYRKAVRYITISGAEVGHCPALPNIDVLIDALIAEHRPKEETHGPPPRHEHEAAQGEEDRIRDALTFIDPYPRKTWCDVGMALKSHLGESGRVLWDNWSKPCTDKFNDRDQNKNWKSFKRNGRIGIGTLFHYAKQGGWQDKKTQRHEPPPTSGGKDARGKQLVVHNADLVNPEAISWSWPGRIAIGKTTLIGGDPGLGKSQLSIFIAATMTVAAEWPCNEGRPPEKRSVVMLSAEDGVADTIVPRLMAAGADRKKVKIVTAVHEADSNGRRIFNLTHDLDVLEKLITEVGDVGLVIIDPVDAYIGGNVDSHKNAAVRAVLEPISELADRLEVAILALTHFSKQLGGKAIYRFIGSIAHIGAARIAFAVVADPEDKTRILLLHAKNNLAPPQKGLAFRVEQHLVAEGVIGSSIHFEKEYVTNTTADEALATESASGATAKDDVIEFLQVVLADGRVKVHDIEAEARAACLLGENQQMRQSKPFRTASDELKIVKLREGFGPGAVHYWSLPQHAPPNTSDSHKRPPQNRAHMGNEGAHDEELDDDGAYEESGMQDQTGSSLHMRPQTPYAPSLGEGTYESAKGAHGVGYANPQGEMVANGFARPGPACLVWIREIRHSGELEF
jgi:putative DNA primase/helicase